MTYKMKCGHTDNAVTSDDKPACAICGCTEVEKECCRIMYTWNKQCYKLTLLE